MHKQDPIFRVEKDGYKTIEKMVDRGFFSEWHFELNPLPSDQKATIGKKEAYNTSLEQNSPSENKSMQKKSLDDTLPPEIIITFPNTRAVKIIFKDKKTTIEGRVEDASGVSEVLVNNKEALLDKAGNFKADVYLVAGENEITVTAMDIHKNKALKKFTIIREELNLTTTPKPVLWVLTIGISKYRNSALDLKFADNDAVMLGEELKKFGGGIFSEVFVKTLVNEQATRGNILTGMSEHLGKASPDDVVFIFVAGHGTKNIQTGSYYFLPYNADSQNLLFEGLKWSDFDEAIKIISNNVNKVILAVDTCRSGAIKVSMRDIQAGEDLAATMQAATGLYVLSASKGGEDSMEGPNFKLPNESKGHGAFTYALLTGLKGEANYDSDSYLTITELFSYVSKQVPRLTSGRQHPYSKIDGTDLPIGIFK